MQLRILIVDDSKTTRRVLSAIVSSRYTVCGEAENGKAAVKKFRELKPDLVLLDLAMPDIDGIEVARQMHAIDPDVPLILVTLVDAWGLESAARNAGIWRIVPKTEGWKLVESLEQIVSAFESSNRSSKSASAKKARPQQSAASAR
jgi:two-component system, chemotaxis family, chemotaxis protein CheY